MSLTVKFLILQNQIAHNVFLCYFQCPNVHWLQCRDNGTYIIFLTTYLFFPCHFRIPHMIASMIHHRHHASCTSLISDSLISVPYRFIIFSFLLLHLIPICYYCSFTILLPSSLLHLSYFYYLSYYFFLHCRCSPSHYYLLSLYCSFTSMAYICI